MTEPEPNSSDPDLAAYLAGELDDAESRAVEARLERDPASRAHADALERTFALLDHLPKPPTNVDFATKTLMMIAASPEALTQVASRTIPVAGSRRPWRILLGITFVALALGAAGGAGARRWDVAPIPAHDLAADYRVSIRLPWYLGCEDLAFVLQLAEANLFAPGAEAPLPDLVATPSGPADKLIALFQSLPPFRQAQLRRLDAEFTALPEAEQARLARILDDYAGWLETLSDAERAQVFHAPPAIRLDTIRTMLATQKRGATAWPTSQAKLVALAGSGRVWPFDDLEFAKQVEGFVRDTLHVELTARLDPTAMGRLSRDEFADLRTRRESALKDGSWGLYGLQIYRLAQRHPYLPEPTGPERVVDKQSLPPDFLRMPRLRLIFPRLERSSARGHWPDYALEVAAEARRMRLAVPESFGPCRPHHLKPNVRSLIEQFTQIEQAKLQRLEGVWPDYPQELVRLAKSYDKPVPGVTLPGKPSQWAAIYAP